MSVVIHTGFFTDHAKNILEDMKTFLSDNWGSRQMARSADRLTIKKDYNNEVILCVENETSRWMRSSAFTDKDTKQIKEWIACTLKNMTYRLMKYRESNFKGYKVSKSKRAKANFWNRKNTADSLEILDNATIAEIYYIFDSLLNRSKIDKHYSKKFIKNMVGLELDPLTVEMKKAFDEEVQKLKDICSREVLSLKSRCEKEIEDFSKRLREENKKQVAARNAQLAEDIKALEAEMFNTENDPLLAAMNEVA
jgi:uncharacterized protein with ParB-like and HNH nuclease domain